MRELFGRAPTLGALLFLGACAGCDPSLGAGDGGSPQPSKLGAGARDGDDAGPARSSEVGALDGGASPLDGGASPLHESPLDGSPEADADVSGIDDALLGREAGHVRYTLEWSLQGAVWDAEAEHYVIELMDGARLHLRSLAVASTSFELIECPVEADGGMAAAERIWDALRWLNPLAPSVAHAHHPAYTEGPSYARAPVAQQVVGATSVDFGSAMLEALDYCELHQVLEPALAEGLLDNETLALDATYFASDDAVGQIIEAGMVLPMASLPALAVEPAAQGADVRVEVTRRVVDALKSVRWTDAPLDLAYALLKALARETDVQVTPADG